MFHLSDTTKTVFQKRKRVGRGNGSNRGKNSGKGHKGQTKRSGKVAVTFEGGMKSLVRRTPKSRGFKMAKQHHLMSISLGIINAQFANGESVSLQTLKAKKLVQPGVKKVRIFNKGILEKKITFEQSDSLHLTKGVLQIISK